MDDNAACRRLAELYAQAVDRNRPELMDAIMAPDAVIEGPGFRMAGAAEIRAIPAMLAQRFRGTRHLVHNQVLEVAGDRATGETHCTASHVLTGEGTTARVLVWHFRYLDEFSRASGQWRFAARRIVIDWTEFRDADLGAGRAFG